MSPSRARRPRGFSASPAPTTVARAIPRPSDAAARRWLTLALLLALATLLGSGAARAQDDRSVFEITPFFGYQFGSEFQVDDFEFGRVELDIDDSEAYGVMVDFGLTRQFQIEIFASRQSSELRFGNDLLSPSPSLGDLDVDILHGGVLYQGARGQLKPYAVLTGGITTLDTDFAGSETYPSIGLGGGVKLEFSDFVGFRLDGRFIFTGVDDQDYDCCYDRRDDTLNQLLVSAGLQLRF